MKFLCVSFSPAIDATVRMDAWPTDGCIIKNAADTFAPGGKTVNVARWLAKRGATVACGGLLGEDNAVMFEKELKKYGIEDRFVRVPGATRVDNGKAFDFVQDEKEHLLIIRNPDPLLDGEMPYILRLKLDGKPFGIRNRQIPKF